MKAALLLAWYATRVRVAMALLCLGVVGCRSARPMADPMPAAVPAPSVVVDLHLHVSMSRSAKPVFKGESGSGILTWDPTAILVNQVEESQLHAAGLRIALGSCWPPFSLRAGRNAFDEAIAQLFELREFGRRRPGFAVVYSVAQVRQALTSGRIAVLPAVEGGEGIASVEDVDRLWLAGMRAITLMHFVNSSIGGAAKGQNARNLLGIKTEKLETLGLTELGKKAVERMMDLGILLDLAHASDALSRDVLDLAETRGIPVVNSHSAARSYLASERSIPDDLAVRIVKGGGLVGVVLNDKMVTAVPAAARWPGFVEGTCDEVVAHWLHLAGLVGAENLVLGSDFNGFITRHPKGGSCPNGLRNVSDLPALWAALEARGIPREALNGMDEKFLSLMEKVEKGAAPKAQAEARQVRIPEASLFAAP